MKTEELAQEIISKLTDEGRTLATAESCTGGLLGKLLTDIPGASCAYKGGVISYVNEIKHRLLGVEQETLDIFTAVSRETAHEMAKGAREVLKTDVGVSTTGLAGPDGDGTGRPVGLVYVALDMEGFSYCRELHLTGSRAEIRAQTAHEALCMLQEFLL